MIRLLDIRVEETDIETSNIPEVRTYNIISGMMSDDCKPFRIAQSAMIWMTEDGYIGEIECIYPIEVDANMCLFKETINRCDGFPAFEVLCCDNEVYVQNKDNGFTIWLTKRKEIDTEIVYKQLRFFVSNGELVGIVCEDYHY
jgi:hypothetical protein